MSTVKDAADALLASLVPVEQVRRYADPGAVVDPPGVVLGAPALTWGTGCADPTEARWLVYLVVAASDRALEELWELLPIVVAALDSVPGAAVIRADPGAYLAGGPELPCYEIQVDYGL